MAGYIYIGKRIFFLKENGTVILEVGEMEGWVIEPEKDFDKALEEAYKYYADLSKYNKEVVDFIDLEYGEYKTEFAECTSFKIDVATRKPIFEYGEKPNPPEVPVTPSLHERVGDLELGAEATQEALDMLLLASMGEPVQAATLAVSTFANTNKQKGADTMAAYIAMRILKKGEKSVEAGRDYYTTWITHPAYAKYKADIDLILKAEGRDDLIVETL